MARLTTAREQAKAALCAVGLLFSALCVAAFVFVWFFVPETRGRSLEEIRRFWKREPWPRGQAA